MTVVRVLLVIAAGLYLVSFVSSILIWSAVINRVEADDKRRKTDQEQ